MRFLNLGSSERRRLFNWTIQQSKRLEIYQQKKRSLLRYNISGSEQRVCIAVVFLKQCMKNLIESILWMNTPFHETIQFISSYDK